MHWERRQGAQEEGRESERGQGAVREREAGGETD